MVTGHCFYHCWFDVLQLVQISTHLINLIHVEILLIKLATFGMILHLIDYVDCAWVLECDTGYFCRESFQIIIFICIIFQFVEVYFIIINNTSRVVVILHINLNMSLFKIFHFLSYLSLIIIEFLLAWTAVFKAVSAYFHSVILDSSWLYFFWRWWRVI